MNLDNTFSKMNMETDGDATGPKFAGRFLLQKRAHLHGYNLKLIFRSNLLLGMQ